MSEFLSIKDPPPVSTNSAKAITGHAGEELAAQFLIAKGYRIVMANFKVPVGRNSNGAEVTGEIDIIALDGETLCFVEVKTRRSEDYAPIEASVNLPKQRQITRTARAYRRIFNVWEMEHRYDVVAVLLPKGETPRIELTKGFWNEASFRKRRWVHDFYSEFI